MIAKSHRRPTESEAFLYGGSDDLHLESLEVPTRTNSGGRVHLWLWRLLNGVMGLFFLSAALVQLNDPDPLLWVPVYGVPCLVSWWVMARSNNAGSTLLEGVILVHLVYTTILGLWTLYLCLPLLSASDPVTNSWWQEEEIMFAEEGKELIGLCLSTAWMMVLKEGVRHVRKRQLLLGLPLTLLPILSWIYLESIEEQIKNC